MRLFFIILLLSSLFWSACGTKSRSQEARLSKAAPNPVSLDGLWVLSNYMDSILAYRTVARYRRLPPAWHAILIRIEGDSLQAYGSIQDLRIPLGSLDHDTLALFDKRCIAGPSWLSYNASKDRIELRRINPSRPDSQVYSYRRSPELRHLLDSLSGSHLTRNSMTRFFSQQLLAGVYEGLSPDSFKGRKIHFHKQGKVDFGSFNYYYVRSYFGTLHLYGEEDVLYFENKKGSYQILGQYNWRFRGDTLILRSFIPAVFWDSVRQEEVITDYWSLGPDEIRLIKQPKAAEE